MAFSPSRLRQDLLTAAYGGVVALAAVFGFAYLDMESGRERDKQRRREEWERTTKKAQEWDKMWLDHWREDELRQALPRLAPSTVGLLGSPGGPGPLLAASALFPGVAELCQHRTEDKRQPPLW